MTDEQMNECREQLATITTVRHRLAKVVNWLERHKDLKVPVSPARIALSIIPVIVALKCAESQLLSYIFPGGIPQEAK